jgi:hypothetical protein
LRRRYEKDGQKRERSNEVKKQGNKEAKRGGAEVGVPFFVF